MKKLYIVLLGVALFAFVIGSVYSGSQSSVSPSPTTEVVTQEKDLTNLASDTLLHLNITNDCPKHAVSHLHLMDCATRVNAILDTASQIDRVESSGFAQHNMDAAVQLDYDRKNLAAELNSFHDEFDGKWADHATHFHLDAGKNFWTNCAVCHENKVRQPLNWYASQYRSTSRKSWSQSKRTRRARQRSTWFLFPQLLSSPPEPATSGAATQGVLLIFYRGYWWPFCNSELRGIEEQLPAFKNLGIRPVAISVDAPEESADLCRKAGYAYTFLSDPNAEVIRRFDLLHPGARVNGHDIARPAEFLLDSSGIVRWVNLTNDLRVRAAPEEMLKAAKALR